MNDNTIGYVVLAKRSDIHRPGEFHYAAVNQRWNENGDLR